jgi:hypothetical protein
MVHMFSAIPKPIFGEAEMSGILPHVEACDVESPIAPPNMPSEPTKRARIEALRAKQIVARFDPPPVAFAELTPMLEEAKAIGWDPLTAEIHHALAQVTRDMSQFVEAREHYDLANELARRSHLYQLEADTWDGLLQAERDVTTEPGTYGGRHAQMLEQAWVAVHNAGDDPVFAAYMTQAEADLDEARGHDNDAIDKFDAARKQATSARDLPHAMRITEDEVIALLRRDNPDDGDRAWKLVVEMARVADEGKLLPKKYAALSSAFWIVALLRGEPEAALAQVDRFDESTPPDGAVEISGRVVDGANNPIAGATVVAWQGNLHGNTARVYGKRDFVGSIATSDRDGKFTVNCVRKECGIIGEQGDRRSQPQLIGDDSEITVALLPTRTIAGRLESDDERLGGVVALAHFELAPGLSWRLTVPVDRTHEFRFKNLPFGEPTLRLDDVLDSNRPRRKIDLGPLVEKVRKTVRWDKGSTIDAIIAKGTPELQWLWVFRGKQDAKTLADLEALGHKLPEMVSHEAFVVGAADQMMVGLPYYTRDARHARFIRIAPGLVTVCMSEPVACQQITVEAGKDTIAVFKAP